MNTEENTEYILELGDINNIKLPYIIKDCVLFSPGNHNSFEYLPEVIKQAFVNTDWNKKTRSLYLDHEDNFTIDSRTGDKTKDVGASVRNWIGEVRNQKLVNNEIRGDLYIVDLDTARKLEFGAHFGISPRGMGLPQKGTKTLKEVLVENYAMVINPAIKTTYLNAENNKQYYINYAMMDVDNKKGENIDNINKEIKNKMDMDAVEGKLKGLIEPLVNQMNETNKKVEELSQMQKKKETQFPEAKIKEELAEKEADTGTNAKVKGKEKGFVEAKEDKKAPLKEKKKEEEEEDDEEEDKKDSKEMNEKDAMKMKIKELEERLKIPSPKVNKADIINVGTTIDEMSDREAHIHFQGYLQHMNGMHETTQETLRREGINSKVIYEE